MARDQIKVGDRVRVIADGIEGRIDHISRFSSGLIGHVWVDLGDDEGFTSFLVSELEVL